MAIDQSCNTETNKHHNEGITIKDGFQKEKESKDNREADGKNRNGRNYLIWRELENTPQDRGEWKALVRALCAQGVGGGG